MKILVIGSGGREHALCWKLAQSPKCEKLYNVPGSDAIARIAETSPVDPADVAGLVRFAQEKAVDLTVVGPEAPLVLGVVDAFRDAGLRIFGPTKDLAEIEGSKVFAKELMKRCNVPTAAFEVFTDHDAALKYAQAKGLPLVVKADGLCAGKGVVVCRAWEEVKDALRKIMIDRAFGHAGDRVIIEECLEGEEASIIVISDGNHIAPLASSQDHKRAFDHDRGPNTGGMGAYSPAPVMTDTLFAQVIERIIRPIIQTLAREGRPYRGALYAGVMVTEKGPMTLEFNARFGDPETQAILPRLKSDLAEVMALAADGKLDGYRLEWDTRPCVSVVLASGGYPGDFRKGMEIRGVEEACALPDTVVFHAGTKLGRRASDGPSMFITNGGRVLNVTALGQDMKGAIDNCYNAVKLIRFDRMHYRKDIAQRALKR